jgi:hypothetical protein
MPGPKPRLRNPSPIIHESENGPGSVEIVSTDWIYADELAADERKLRAFFKVRAPQLKQRPGENLIKAVRRIRELAAVALDHCDAAMWRDGKVSGFVAPPRRYARATWSRYHAKKHVGPRPPKKAPR